MKHTVACRIKQLPIFVCILFASEAYSQYVGDNHLNTPDPNQTSFYSPDGQPHENFTAYTTDFADVSNMNGSPFFMADWQKGAAWFKNGKQYNNGDLQFNWVKNELHFRYSGKTCLFADTVAEFLLFDTAGGAKVADFKNGYPATGMHNTSSFYQVIKAGAKYQLLVYWTKIEREVYSYGGPYEKQYFKKADWYVYDVKSDKISYIELKPRSLKKALPAREGEIEKLCGASKKLTETQLLEVINGLNTL